MKIFLNDIRCRLVLGSLLAAGLVAPAFGMLSSPTDVASGNGSSYTHSEPHLACLSPLISSTGGLCCPGLPSSAEPCLKSSPGSISIAVGKLQPIFVNGVRLPLPIALQMIKKALKRPWSHAPEDRNNLVCRYQPINVGSRIRSLHCNTNSEYFHSGIETYYHLKSSDIKVRCYNNCMLTQGNVVISVARYVNGDSKRARLLGALLAKVPLINSNYSLRVPERVPIKLFIPSGPQNFDYPLFVTFVINNGGLANIELKARTGSDVEPPRAIGKDMKRLKALRAPPKPTRSRSTEGILCTASNLKC